VGEPALRRTFAVVRTRPQLRGPTKAWSSDSAKTRILRDGSRHSPRERRNVQARASERRNPGERLSGGDAGPSQFHGHPVGEGAPETL